MLYDRSGNRKYLTSKERKAFLKASRFKEPKLRTFCEVLVYTGARISEVLALSPARIDWDEQSIVIECLKKRRRGIFRVVPVPVHLLKLLYEVHDLSRRDGNCRLWSWGRTTAWRRVKHVMEDARIPSAVAKPKALRHTFGVQGTQIGVSLNLIKRWLGHSRLETTALYTEVVGDEERKLAMKMWSS